MTTKEKKQKQKTATKVSVNLSETRQALMLLAKERGIKNFRVLNKGEARTSLG